MPQLTFASQPSFEKYARTSRREQFLATMEKVVPWRELEDLIEPYYPKAGNGRQPVGLTIMLRVYFLQQWFALSDPGAEDALYESPVLRRFAGIDLGRAAAPDETTILRFRRLLEEHALCGRILDAVNGYLESRGLRIATGTIVDATIIAAPSSTKNSGALSRLEKESRVAADRFRPRQPLPEPQTVGPAGGSLPDKLNMQRTAATRLIAVGTGAVVPVVAAKNGEGHEGCPPLPDIGLK
jgi:IS5 family transposase